MWKSRKKGSDGDLKRTLLYSIFTVIVAFFLTVVIVLAWFMVSEKTEPVVITTGALRAQCNLYYGLDSDFDGELDDGTYAEITTAGIEFTNVIPGQIYTYRLVVRNKGTVDGILSISINDIIATAAGMYEGFSVSFTDPETKDLAFVNGDLELFTELFLAEGDTYEFNFLIKINETISAEFRYESLTITNFIVRLDQTY
ncbi:MAG TPA: hypothetical protein PKO39_06710 [Bacilli bacterium]|nr:hypothetical protein [Bacilli bacterium]HQC90165.1 hypothetical protein [Bacilli bacterium]